MNDRFLVVYDAGPGGRWWHLIAAPSRESIEEHYPLFARGPILRLPGEQPKWLSDDRLTLIERYGSHVLGESEPFWLESLLQHDATREEYVWYLLAMRGPDGSVSPAGKLSTRCPLQVGELVNLPPPAKGTIWRIVKRRDAEPLYAGKLVLEHSRRRKPRNPTAGL